MSSRPSSFTLTRPGPLRLYSMVELLRLPPPTWLVREIVPSGGLVGLYGEPGSFKSFIAIDIAMSVATGRPWHGQEVEKNHVLYVAAEGGTGIAKRGAAWLKHYGVSPSQVDIAWLIESVPVNPDSEQMDILFDRVNGELTEAPGLVVIDTLARCFEGDENTQEDMGKFVAGVDRMRRDFNSTVIVVHHTRLGGDRERGNTAFRGAADAMITVERHGDEVEVGCNKQKDAPEFLTRQLLLKQVEGETPDLSSVVFIEPGKSRDDAILAFLNEPKKFTELKLLAEGLTISPAALKRRLVSLVRTGKITKENGYYAII